MATIAVSQDSKGKGRKGVPYDVVLPQNPYIEQQFPLSQFPQTVSPFELPHVPSVVVAVAAEEAAVVVTGTMTGSWEVVVVTDVAPPVHPL